MAARTEPWPPSSTTRAWARARNARGWSEKGLVEIGHARNGRMACLADRARIRRGAPDPEGCISRSDGIGPPLPCEPCTWPCTSPADYECSHTPSHHQSVFDLLPGSLRHRGMQAVGRLDADTTGLLLLSDSGSFNHFFTSPRRHVPKTYRVETRHPIAAGQVARIDRRRRTARRGRTSPCRPHVQLLEERPAR